MKSPSIAALIAQAEQLQQAARDERAKTAAAYGLPSAPTKSKK